MHLRKSKCQLNSESLGTIYCMASASFDYDESYAAVMYKQKFSRLEDAPDMSDIFSPTSQQLVNLEGFVEAAQQHSLVNLGVCTSVEKLLEAAPVQKEDRTDKEMKTNQFMNDKKSHEVLKMSQLVGSIARVCGIKQVIDLGAGKGYLSSYLSMQYDLKVYGIDSSHSNTDGANKRNRKLKKYWKAYKMNARKTSKAQDSNQKRENVLPNNMCQDVNTDEAISKPQSSASTLEESSISDASAVDKINVIADSIRWKTDTESNQNIHPVQDQDTEEHSFLDILPSGAVEVTSMSKSVSKDLSEQEKEQRKMENIKAKKQNDSHVYLPVTSYVTAETELHDIITDLEDSIMVGLHTCGDLAPNTLRIFTAKPEIKAVCSVGCCYHLLTEEFGSPAEDRTGEAWGFPMSRYLKESGWCFGRNARMSACLALERVAVGQGLPNESLFYRAVLQVIFRECFGTTQSDKRIGKIFSKSSGFTDYVRKSLKRFGQDDSKISDKQIMDYYEYYMTRKNELEAFNMLKVLLAPCIEALILLDRLLYLKEQENLAWSGLVKLFDPVKSPRCYAVVSMKKA
ncbi:putative methyltransferase-like protein 25 [Rhinophrynus dorsalis]